MEDKYLISVFSCLAMLGGGVRFYFKQLEIEDKRNIYIKELSSTKPLQIYKKNLERGLQRVKQHFDSSWSSRALGTCMLWSLVYALAFFLLTWLFGGSGKIGSVQFLPQQIPDFRKLFFILLTFLLGILVWRFSTNWAKHLYQYASFPRLFKTVFYTSIYTAVLIFAGIFTITENPIDSGYIGLSGYSSL